MPGLPCSRNGCRPATRRDPRPPAPCPSWPRIVATPALESRPSLPTHHPGTPRRSIGSCDTTSSPTPPPRTELAGRAALRYRCTPPRHQPASTSPAPTPCPDHGTATGAEEPAPTATRPTRGGPPGTPARATDVRDNLLAAASHHHRNRAVSVHLRSALLLGDLLLSTSAVSLARRASSRTRDPQLTDARE